MPTENNLPAGECALWLPAYACAAAAGGLADQRQARAPAVQSGRPADAAQTAAPPSRIDASFVTTLRAFARPSKSPGEALNGHSRPARAPVDCQRWQKKRKRDRGRAFPERQQRGGRFDGQAAKRPMRWSCRCGWRLPRSTRSIDGPRGPASRGRKRCAACSKRRWGAWRATLRSRARTEPAATRTFGQGEEGRP